MSKISILVNTCDRFEDCWEPFFKLFSIYWPDFSGKIYLNTDYCDFNYGDLDITSLKVCAEKMDADNIAWSECLLRALDKIDDDYVLYMQEDYFLKAPVQNEGLEFCLQTLYKHPEIDCIHLTPQGAPGVLPSTYEKLKYVPQFHQYRICCQAALWKKSVLQECLREHETGWAFEWWGSKRAAILKHNFLAVDPNWVNRKGFELIPYVTTGVIQGKWFIQVVPLFEKHDIKVDYSVRGFYEVKRMSTKQMIQSKLKRSLPSLRSRLDLIGMKLKLNYKTFTSFESQNKC